MTLPWTHFARSPWDKITDTLVIASCLFEDGAKLENLAPVEAVPKAIDLLRRCSELDFLLMQLSDELENADPKLKPLYWEEPSSNYQHETPISFVSLDAAITMMLLWGATAIIWREMCFLHDFITTFMPARSPDSAVSMGSPQEDWKYTISIPMLGPQKQYYQVARKVYRSVSYCMNEENSLAGPLLALLPLRLVLKFFEGEDIDVIDPRWGANGIGKPHLLDKAAAPITAPTTELNWDRHSSYSSGYTSTYTDAGLHSPNFT